VIVAVAAGYGQFGAVAALGQVARAFGHPLAGSSVAAEAGLSGVALGGGLAILRLASLLGMPLTALADRLGRRPTLLAWAIAGLCLTMAAAASPSYWWFIAIFALGRPLLSAAAALAQVVTAESSAPANRARSLAIVSAGYGVGAGLNALVHTALRGEASFRVLFLTCAVPLLAVLVVATRVPEPVAPSRRRSASTIGFAQVGAGRGGRLLAVMGLIAATSMTSAAASSFVFVYAENVAHLGKGLESAMILLAAITGLVGLVVGRRLADHLGRRPAIGIGAVGIAAAALVLYSGSRMAVVAGYLFAVLATGLIAPAGTAFPNELFDTEVRATVAGYGIVAGVLGAVVGLLTFGIVADRTGSFELAAVAVAVPVVASLSLLVILPETKGAELAGTIGAAGR
jgi:MFS family permease